MDKNQLNKYICLSLELERIEEKYQVLQASICKKTAHLSNEARSTISKNLDDKIIELLELKDKIIAQQQAIIDEIDNVSNPKSRIILQYRYLDGMNWEKISRKLNYSRSQVYRYHDSALKKIK